MANLRQYLSRQPRPVHYTGKIALAHLLMLIGGFGCSSDSSGVAASFARFAPPVLVNAFMTPDQQGRALFEAELMSLASDRFEDPIWKGIALERNGDLTSAALAYRRVDSPRGLLHLGNVYARLEELPAAIAAYDRALAAQPEFPEASFNRDWVLGLIAVDEKEYEDFGGTGGKLEADKIVFDDRAKDAIGQMTVDEARAQGLSTKTIREIWMRRVQTTPGEFLRLKFAYQAQLEAPNGESTQ